MRFVHEAAMRQWSPSPSGAAIMARNRRSAAADMELKMLQLAAFAADLRRQLSAQELAKAPRLAAVLDACDALFEELGWGDPSVLPQPGDEFDH
jgi:hypothetical protein